MDIDELLDFSKGYELYCPPTATNDSEHHHLHHHHHQHHHHHAPSETIPSASIFPIYHPSDFTNTLCVPNDDVAELEWLSKFVDDSFSDYPQNNVTGTINFRSETSFHSRSRSKRSRLPSTNWTSTPESVTPITLKSSSKSIPKTDNNNNNNNNNTIKIKREVYSPSSSDTSESAPRRCTHCASEKTPQWRTGPLGPKTLCNACGVRYKSGRLVPEYRPAASPTFVLTQHSNSHRKVMELRRQKEMHSGGGGGGGGGGGQQQQQEVHHQLYGHGHHHRRNYEVC